MRVDATNSLTAVAVLAFGMATLAAAAPIGEHRHEEATTQALKSNVGRKWQTDVPLRKGMEEIRNAVAAESGAIHAGRVNAGGYEALAKTVDAQVTHIVQQCKLPPEADAQLHLVLAQLMQGATAMKGVDPNLARRDGIDRVATALDAYGRYFDHPGWPGIPRR